MARRYDPERRGRIIDAAIRVVATNGIGGLSHRTVAAEADVPLGSTTYHFASLDELMVAALRRTNEGFGAAVRDSGALADPGADVAEELARLMGEWLAGERTGVELEYELYLGPCGGPRCGRSPRNGARASPRSWPGGPIRSRRGRWWR